MKTHKLLTILAILPIALFLGCETDSADKHDFNGDITSSESSDTSPDILSGSIKIKATETELTSGESTTLEASGGKDYTWELRDPDYGTLSSKSGSKVTYTASDINVTGTVTQTITVTGTVSGGQEKTASKTITQK